VATKHDLAAMYGVSLTVVNDWLARGMPCLVKGTKSKTWRFDPIAVRQWHDKNVNPDLADVNTPPNSPALDESPNGAFVDDDNKEVYNDELMPSNLEPVDRKHWFDSELKRLDLATRKGLLLDTSEVEGALAAAFAEITSAVRNIPASIENKFNDMQGIDLVVNFTTTLVEAQLGQLYKTLRGISG